MIEINIAYDINPGVETPSLDQGFDQLPSIEELLAPLNDGRANTSSITPDADCGFLTISVAAQGYLITFYSDPLGGFVLRERGVLAETDVVAVTGGQAAEWDANMFVDHTKAVAAIQYFGAHRKLNPELIWKEA